jgi:hypothetical protein
LKGREGDRLSTPAGGGLFGLEQEGLSSRNVV